MWMSGEAGTKRQLFYSTDLKPLYVKNKDEVKWYTLDRKTIKFPDSLTADLEISNKDVNSSIICGLTKRLDIEDYDDFGINFRKLIFILLDSKMEIVECRIQASPLELYKSNKVSVFEHTIDSLLPEIVKEVTAGHWVPKDNRHHKGYYYGGIILSII